MKTFTLTLLIALFSGSMAFAQNSNLIFFSENGEKFFVIIDGLKYNNVAETNVKVTDLTPTMHLAKVIFEDPANGELEKKIPLDPATETTVRIVRKSQSKAGKGLKNFSNKIKKDLNNEFENVNEDTTAKEDWYVMRFQSAVPLGGAATHSNTTTNTSSGTSSGQTTYVSGGSATTTTGTTSTTHSSHSSTSVTSSGSAGGTGANISMNVNINDGGATNDVHYQETTTTTHTSGGAVTTTDHYVMPGYGGPVGCPWPMESNDFESAKRSISAKDFEDSKLTIAKQVIRNNCLVADQVREIMGLFDFESTKLDFAKFAYHYTYDLGNYFKVNDAFDFESSIDELNEYINAQGN